MESKHDKRCISSDLNIDNKNKSFCYNITTSANEDAVFFTVDNSIKVETSENTSISSFDSGILIDYCDYAELFETVDGHQIDVGYFVTFEGEKVRKAISDDSYILGVTSATPGILGNCNNFEWKDKYLKDEWGRIQYNEIRTPVVIDKKGKSITLESIERRPILNPEWDSTKEYISRLSRSEWVAVGLLGKILVRDDATCQVNGYCKPNDEGIATSSNKGYRIIKRTGPNQVLILFR